MNCFESFEYSEKRIASIHTNFLPSLIHEIGFLRLQFSTAPFRQSSVLSGVNSIYFSLLERNYECAAKQKSQNARWLGSGLCHRNVLFHFNVPLSTWGFRNFKPEFLLNGKRPRLCSAPNQVEPRGGAFHSTKILVWNFGNFTCPMERYIPVAQTRRLVIVFCKNDTKERYWAVPYGVPLPPKFSYLYFRKWCLQFCLWCLRFHKWCLCFHKWCLCFCKWCLQFCLWCLRFHICCL